jgi:putative peptide zinc metalloprotease protein
VSEGFLSSSWYRIAPLRPVLKSQARIRRHRFRGQVWYVVQDLASGRFNRFTPATYQLLALMDGKRTMDEIWTEVVEQLDEDAPSQDEVIRLLSQLHAADLMHCEVNPDSAELFERFSKQQRSVRQASLKNPFSIRIRLWDPDKFLERTLRYVEPLFSRAGAIAYCALLLLALVLAALHWPELTQNISDRVLATHNLVILWLCFPVVKFLHEMGHGYAAKAGGGEVHEMGILLLVFMPVPYVDASAASAFRSRWRRSAVGAAGMMTELYIAALAMLVWVAAEPGWARAVAFNLMLIAGVSTIVFNLNPLLRFDGYYIFSDLIEMPNLAQRGNQYWRYLAERYLFRMKKAEPPPLTPGERRWLLVYTPAAMVYRVFVLIAIVLYIAAEWFFIGVALALWGAATMLLWPVAKLYGYLTSLPRAQNARQKAITVSAALLAALLAFVLFVPVPLRIQAEGVVWLPEEANVRAGANGFVHAVLEQPGTPVEPGTPLVVSRDPVLETQIDVHEARVAELEAKLDAERFTERVKAEITRQDLERERAAYARMVERAGQLVARSAAHGRLIMERPGDMPGRFVRKGELLGYVTEDARKIVRAVVSQDDVDLVRTGLLRAEVRLAEALQTVHPAAVVREVPAAKDQVPSAALTTEGGGALAPDPRDPKSGRTLNSSFQFDLALPPAAAGAAFGGRAYVRFVHAPEPLAQQWYRRLRQAFLARFNV